VALREGLSATPDELIEHCRASLARFKVPREVFVLEILPKNAVGKISKQNLRELCSTGAEKPTRSAASRR
jgi:acyl-CoA synthetase (AMP-forming)/AMP-acid ligase II